MMQRTLYSYSTGAQSGPVGYETTPMQHHQGATQQQNQTQDNAYFTGMSGHDSGQTSGMPSYTTAPMQPSNQQHTAGITSGGTNTGLTTGGTNAIQYTSAMPNNNSDYHNHILYGQSVSQPSQQQNNFTQSHTQQQQFRNHYNSQYSNNTALPNTDQSQQNTGYYGSDNDQFMISSGERVAETTGGFTNYSSVGMDTGGYTTDTNKMQNGAIGSGEGMVQSNSTSTYNTISGNNGGGVESYNTSEIEGYSTSSNEGQSSYTTVESYNTSYNGQNNNSWGLKNQSNVRFNRAGPNNRGFRGSRFSHPRGRSSFSNNWSGAGCSRDTGHIQNFDIDFRDNESRSFPHRGRGDSGTQRAASPDYFDNRSPNHFNGQCSTNSYERGNFSRKGRDHHDYREEHEDESPVYLNAANLERWEFLRKHLGKSDNDLAAHLLETYEQFCRDCKKKVGESKPPTKRKYSDAPEELAEELPEEERRLKDDLGFSDFKSSRSSRFKDDSYYTSGPTTSKVYRPAINEPNVLQTDEYETSSSVTHKESPSMAPLGGLSVFSKLQTTQSASNFSSSAVTFTPMDETDIYT